MGFPIDVSDIKDYINVENFTLDLLKSKEYHLRKMCFCLLASLEDIVLEFDRNERLFSEERMLWVEFLQLHYQKLNYSRNILKSVLKDGIIEKNDLDFINESIQWAIELLKVILDDDGKRVNYINIIISGWFYCSLHYYIKSIDAYCEKKFNLVKPYIENRRALKIIEEERLTIDQLHKEITEQKLTNEAQLNEDTHNKLLNIWFRALDFLETELIPEFHTIEAIQ